MTIRRSHPATVLGPLTLLLALAVAGCGGGANSSDASSGRVARDGGDAPAASADSISGKSSDTTLSVGNLAARTEPVRTRAVISTGSVELVSRDVAATRDQVDALLTRNDGFLADERTRTGSGGHATSARLVLRVPSARFETVMTDLAKLGKLQDTTRKAKDVSTEVIDVEQRVRAQRIGLHRLEVLLGRATSLPNLLKVEREVTQRRADLDSLTSQQAYLTNQTTLATITVRIDRSARPVKHPDHTGFGAGLEAGRHGLSVFLTGTLTAVGAVLPFAGAALVLLLPTWGLLRLVRRVRGPVTATEE